jgi:hypothetical protein
MNSSRDWPSIANAFRTGSTSASNSSTYSPVQGQLGYACVCLLRDPQGEFGCLRFYRQSG